MHLTWTGDCRRTTGTASANDLSVVVLFLLPALALAQSSGIAGTVSDQSGGALPGVTVEVSSAAMIEGSRTTITNGEGRYAVAELRPGSYTVTFTLTGFSTVKREGITLNASFTANVNVQLPIGTRREHDRRDRRVADCRCA